MNIFGITLITLNFILIGLLPYVFFKRDGKRNLRWWLTALPFLVALVALWVHPSGIIAPTTSNTFLLFCGQAVAALLSATSIFVIGLTLGSHRIPIALWHQNNDAPVEIVTWGSYSKVRHPFYTSFLLTFVAAFLFSPQPLTLAALVYGFVALNLTAAREERRLCNSSLSREYQSYMAKTGRFMPKLGA